MKPAAAQTIRSCSEPVAVPPPDPFVRRCQCVLYLTTAAFVCRALCFVARRGDARSEVHDVSPPLHGASSARGRSRVGIMRMAVCVLLGLHEDSAEGGEGLQVVQVRGPAEAVLLPLVRQEPLRIHMWCTGGGRV